LFFAKDAFASTQIEYDPVLGYNMTAYGGVECNFDIGFFACGLKVYRNGVLQPGSPGYMAVSNTSRQDGTTGDGAYRVEIWGTTATPTFTTELVYALSDCIGGVCTDVPATPPYEDTHINSLIPDGFTSTTSPFTFRLDFYNGTTTPVVRINMSLYDEHIGGGDGFLWRTADIPMSFSQNADHVYSSQFSAYPVGLWALHANLYDVNDNLITATTTRFYISSDSSGYQDYFPNVSTSTPSGFDLNLPEFVASSLATTSLASTTSLLSFLNVPHLLATRVPFAYIYLVSSAISSSISTTSASVIPSGSFSVHWKVPNFATTTINIDMFSTSTITYFLTPTYLSLLRALMVAVTFYGTGWYLFHRAKDPNLFK